MSEQEIAKELAFNPQKEHMQGQKKSLAELEARFLKMLEKSEGWQEVLALRLIEKYNHTGPLR